MAKTCFEMATNANLATTIQVNHQPDATIFQFVILLFIYSSTCFGLSPAYHQELNDYSSSLWFYLRIVVIVVLCSWSGRPVGRPDHEDKHGYHHDAKVKSEATAAVIELLMMGGRTPKTCWAINKRQDNKLENCCIWLVIYLNFAMMHGLTNLKSSNYSSYNLTYLMCPPFHVGCRSPMVKFLYTACNISAKNENCCLPLKLSNNSANKNYLFL